MKKPDEIELFNIIDKETDMIKIPEITKKLTNDKRTYYILSKWADSGYINYGVSLNYPWKTEKWHKLKEIIKKEQQKPSLIRKAILYIKNKLT